jgi:hypothetical protein
MSSARRRCELIRLFGCLVLAVLATPAMDAAATTNPLDVTSAVTDAPVLTGAACTGERRSVLMVTGEQFTAGGQVDVMLFMPGNTHPSVIRSLRASQSFVGTNGSTDPALGFQQGGFVGLAVSLGCQKATTVRAFDRQSGTWSNEVSVDLSCEAAT